jgi:hypothetical protein
MSVHAGPETDVPVDTRRAVPDECRIVADLEPLIKPNDPLVVDRLAGRGRGRGLGLDVEWALGILPPSS